MIVWVLAFANACAMAAASASFHISPRGQTLMRTQEDTLAHTSLVSDPLQVFISSCVANVHPETCPFVKEGSVPLGPKECAMEMTTVSEIHTYFSGSSRKVLELGARYGTTSCTMADAVTAHGGAVVSIEPDPRVWSALTQNLAQNKCNVNLVKGVLSKTKAYSQGRPGISGYGNAVSSDSRGTPTPNYALDDVMKMYKVDHFDTLVADCQGCLPQVLDENPALLKMLTFIINEEDQHGGGVGAEAFYKPMEEKLKSAGFKLQKRNADAGSPGSNRGDFIWVREP